MSGRRSWRRPRALIALGLLLLIVAPETAATGRGGGDELRGKPFRAAALFITVYDWGLGGINCDGDCSNTALTTTGDELLGRTAACPSAWLGYIRTTVVTIWGQQFWCVDAFGQPEHRALTEVDGRPVYRIDLAFRPAAAHPWNQEFVPAGDWSREWRPMSEFEQLRAQWSMTNDTE